MVGVVAGLLESLNDFLEGVCLRFLSLEHLHGFLVEFELVDLLDYCECDSNWLTKGSSLMTNERELSSMLFLS